MGDMLLLKDQMINGGFETGSLGGLWVVPATSSGNVILAIGTTANSITPFQGSYRTLVDLVSGGSQVTDTIIHYLGSMTALNSGTQFSIALAAVATNVKTIACLIYDDISDVLPQTQVGIFNTSWVSYCVNIVSIKTPVAAPILRFYVGGNNEDLWIDSFMLGRSISLKPSYKYDFVKTLNRADLRTRVGALYTYIDEGEFIKFKLPLSWVNSSDRTTITDWWKAGSDLKFIEDSSFPHSFHNVRIVGVDEPFQTYVKPYFRTYFEGALKLETI